MTMQLHCNCGRQLRVRSASAGKLLRCQHCGATIRVPDAQAPQEPRAATLVVPQIATSSSMPIYRDSSNTVSLALQSKSIGEILTGMVVVWGVLILLTVVIAATSKLQALGLAILTCIVTLCFAFAAAGMMRAKKLALKRGEAYAWFGLLGIVAWDPNQGVLFLKDKMIGPVDSNPHDGGGVMLLLPWLGEELAFRAPLEVRTTKFVDENVLTREYVPVTIKGAIYWRVTDLERFYLSVSRGIHEVDDRGGHRVSHGFDGADALDSHSFRAGTAQQIEAGEEWLRLIAEEQTRAEVLHARTGLLIADKIVEGLPAEMQSLVATDSYREAAEGLAEGIRRRIEAIATQYGIYAERVSLQEVQLDPKIRAAAIAACVSAYQPLIAQRFATAKKMDLEADAYGQKKMLEGEAEVIGREAVAKREVLGSVKPLAFGGRFGVVDVLEEFFENFTPGGTAGDSQDQGRQLSRTSSRRPPTSPAQGPNSSLIPAEPIFDDEAVAKDLLNQAKEFHNAGDVQRSIWTLEQIVDGYGSTRAAQYARNNLAKLRAQNS